MTKHDFDFDDAMTIVQFYKKNRVNKGSRKFIIKECHAEDGNTFKALGLATGDTLEDGRPEYSFFVLSRNLEEQGETLNLMFLKEHKEDLMLLEPVDDLKFGICFLSGGAMDFDEL